MSALPLYPIEETELRECRSCFEPIPQGDEVSCECIGNTVMCPPCAESHPPHCAARWV